MATVGEVYLQKGQEVVYVLPVIALVAGCLGKDFRGNRKSPSREEE